MKKIPSIEVRYRTKFGHLRLAKRDLRILHVCGLQGAPEEHVHCMENCGLPAVVPAYEKIDAAKVNVVVFKPFEILDVE
jgi:hypothetical protein